jgi:hypothetical protein
MWSFINNKIVQLVAWIVLALSSLILILAGVKAGDIAKVPTMIVGIVDAVALLVIFIKKMLQAKDTANK